MCYESNLEGVSENLEDGGVIYYHKISQCSLTSFYKRPEDVISNVRCRLTYNGSLIKQFVEGVDYRILVFPYRFHVLDFDPFSPYGRFRPDYFFLLDDMPLEALEKNYDFFGPIIDRQGRRNFCVEGSLEISFEVR